VVKLVLLPRVESLVGRRVFAVEGPCQGAFDPARRGVIVEDGEDRWGRRTMIRWDGEDEDDRRQGVMEQPVKKIGVYLE